MQFHLLYVGRQDWEQSINCGLIHCHSVRVKTNLLAMQVLCVQSLGAHKCV